MIHAICMAFDVFRVAAWSLFVGRSTSVIDDMLFLFAVRFLSVSLFVVLHTLI